MLKCNSSKHEIKGSDMPGTLEEKQQKEIRGKVFSRTLQALGIENPI